MNNGSFALLALTVLAACSAPEPNETNTPEPATTMTDSIVQPVTIHPVHHSAMVLEWNGLTIHVDPHEGAARFAGYPAPNLVLITDIHPDHLDSTTLLALDLSKARIIAPQAVVDALPQQLKSLATPLANGARMDVQGIGLEAVPMYNLPEKADGFHTKGRGNGYVITLGKERLYVSGDTQGIPEMRALKNIDVAFVCMNLPYTMTVDEAADAVLAFKPKAVYPYHYRGKDGLSDVARFKQLVLAGGSAIDVRLEDWYK